MIAAYNITYFFLIVGQPDVDMCKFTVYNKTLYGTPFINITITQLWKPMTSQFDDRLIIGYGKTVTNLKKFEFHNPSKLL